MKISSDQSGRSLSSLSSALSSFDISLHVSIQDEKRTALLGCVCETAQYNLSFRGTEPRPGLSQLSCLNSAGPK